MSSASLETVKKIAALARLHISPAEGEALAGQFDAILAHFQSLTELDVEGVEPMTAASQRSDVLRPDEPRPSLPTDALLEQAPQRIEDFYSVPKTIGGVG